MIRPGFVVGCAALASACLAVLPAGLVPVTSSARADGPVAADPLQRVALGDAAGVLALLADGYRKGTLDVRSARLYQDLRVEAGQTGALVDETKAAFPEPRSVVGQYLLGRISPRKEVDLALQRLVPLVAPADLGLLLLDQAWAAVRGDNLPHALALLPKTKKLTPDLEETVLLEAQVLETGGDRSVAERLLAAYCAAHPDAIDARRAWVDELVALRRLGDAAAVAEQGLRRARAPTFLAGRAAVAIEMLDFEAARKFLDEAKDAGRPSVRAEVNALRAAARLAARDAPGAEAAARAGLEASPTSVVALRALARALEIQGKFPEALARLDAALDVRPGNARVLTDRAVVFHALGQDREAKRALAEARKRDPSYLESLIYQGILAEEDSDWVGAEKAYRAVLKADPDRLEAHRMLGGVLFSMGKLEPAGAEAEWIRDRFPKDAHAWFLTGRVHLKGDRIDEALAAFDKAVEYEPKYAFGHIGRGWVLEEQDKREDAKKAYEAAIAADPTLPLPHRYLAELLEDKGDNPDAAKEFKAYLDLGGADPDEDVRHAVDRLSK